MPSDESVKSTLSSSMFRRSGSSDENEDAALDDQLFRTIAVQLQALGLVKVQYSRSTSGYMSLFWSLTPSGQRTGEAGRTRRAKALRGTWLVFPLLSSGTIRMLPSKSTSRQRAPYCSPRRSPVCRARSNSGACSGNFSRITLRSSFSSFGVRKRIRPLFSAWCWISRAGQSSASLRALWNLSGS